MKKEKLLKQWTHEEEIAHIKGWDFSHLRGRYEEENDLPWDYERSIRTYLKPEDKLLDIDTGGGEFLKALSHPYANTWCSEGYPPNAQMIKQQLTPLGIHVIEAQPNALPLQDAQFDIIINRHGDLEVDEVYRLLKPKGIFITEQVGAHNDRELVTQLLGEIALPFPQQYLSIREKEMKEAGFHILDAQEAYRPITFYDVGALVWFARIIEWEFPNFKVENCIPQLFALQKVLEEKGKLVGSIHRFFLVAQKQ